MKLNTAPPITPLLSMGSLRTSALHLILLLSFTIFHLAAGETCWSERIQNLVENDMCPSCTHNPSAFLQGFSVDEASANHVAQGPDIRHGIRSTCASSYSFCFLSPLLGSALADHNLKPAALKTDETETCTLSPLGSANTSLFWSNTKWPSNNDLFELLDGRKFCCLLNYGDGSRNPFLSFTETGNDNPKFASICSGSLVDKNDIYARMGEKPNTTSSFGVEVRLPVLDLGERFLLLSSEGFLTVENRCNNSSNRQIYKAFGSDGQFHPCNLSEMELLPGEVASVCFLFLPRWLVPSSAQVVLQTNIGRFIIKAQGVAVESPYGTQTLISINFPYNLWSLMNLSLINPLNENLFAEIMPCISDSSGNASCQTSITCLGESSQDSHEASFIGKMDWLIQENSQDGLDSMAARLFKDWEIGPDNGEDIMQIEFSLHSGGKLTDVVFLELHRASQEQPDRLLVLVPFEFDLYNKCDHNNYLPPFSASVQPLVQYDSDEMVAVISLKNTAPYVLSVVKITETSGAHFHIKYNEGVLLFPGSVTLVALASVQLHSKTHDPPEEVSKVDGGCVLLILTNDSTNPQVEIVCEDIFRMFSENGKTFSAKLRHQHDKIDSRNQKNGSPGSRLRSSMQYKVLGGTEADELILGTWKSYGTRSGLSVLKEPEVIFPITEVGTQASEWITVKNPSHYPVVMQLVLNSGEIISACRDQDSLIRKPSPVNLVQGETLRPENRGFSVAENAVTEAHVHAYGEASFGPIYFHPSNRCRWRSSALIRNNLSGVEWLPLMGSGGSSSLTLLEDRKPVQNLEFNFNLPKFLNVSSLSMLFDTKRTFATCSEPLSKEIYAKNTGDLPLEVKSIMVSGRDCGVDGFTVNSCEAFSLEPGEATKFLISYRTDFSAYVIHRDLELVLASGILAAPIKATVPVLLLNVCKKSAFLLQLKRFSLVVLPTMVFLVLYCVFSQVIPSGYQDCFYDRDKSLGLPVRSLSKSCRAQRSKTDGKLSVVNCTLRRGQERIFVRASLGKYPIDQDGDSEEGPASKRALLSNLKDQGEAGSSAKTTESANLVVNTRKIKRKNRKKKRGTVGDLTGAEVSSSQSGNSTPSSPLSPIRPSTPNDGKSPDSDQSGYPKNTFARAAGRECKSLQLSRPVSRTNEKESNATVRSIKNNRSASTREQPLLKGVPTNSSTSPFPSSRPAPSLRCSSPFVSTSLVSHARAPGSRLRDREAGGSEGKRQPGEYVYDIWGNNHLSGLRLMERLKGVDDRETSSTEEDSFFVKDPLTFWVNFQPQYASFFKQEGY